MIIALDTALHRQCIKLGGEVINFVSYQFTRFKEFANKLKDRILGKETNLLKCQEATSNFSKLSGELECYNKQSDQVIASDQKGQKENIFEAALLFVVTFCPTSSQEAITRYITVKLDLKHKTRFSSKHSKATKNGSVVPSSDKSEKKIAKQTTAKVSDAEINHNELSFMELVNDEASVQEIVERLEIEILRLMPEAGSCIVNAVSPVIYSPHDVCEDCIPKFIYFQDAGKSREELSLLVKHINKQDRFSTPGFDPDHSSESFQLTTPKLHKPKEKLVVEDTEFCYVPCLTYNVMTTENEYKNAISVDIASNGAFDQYIKQLLALSRYGKSQNIANKYDIKISIKEDSEREIHLVTTYIKPSNDSAAQYIPTATIEPNLFTEYSSKKLDINTSFPECISPYLFMLIIHAFAITLETGFSLFADNPISKEPHDELLDA